MSRQLDVVHFIENAIMLKSLSKLILARLIASSFADNCRYIFLIMIPSLHLIQPKPQRIPMVEVRVMMIFPSTMALNCSNCTLALNLSSKVL